MFSPFLKFQFLTQAQEGRVDSVVTQYDKFAESIVGTFNKNLTINLALVIVVSLFVLFIAGVVFYEVVRSNKTKKKTAELAWERFNRFVAQTELSANAIDLLKNIATVSGHQDPESIIKSPSAFENSLDRYYDVIGIESMSQRKLMEIRDLRRKLGFLPLSKEIAFTSTRQFDRGERCIVQIPEDGDNATHKGMCSAVSIEEDKWYISRPEGPKIPEKTGIRISLTRSGDAEYVFSVQVLKDSADELVLSHTNKLNRTQQRNWVRIDVSIPVEVTQVINKGIGDIFSGKIIDMSGGGFGIILPARLLNGSKLLMNFDLPGQGPVNDLPVKVVRVAGAFGKDPSKIIHSVAFEQNMPVIQEQIIQYVFEKQRQEALFRRG